MFAQALQSRYAPSPETRPTGRGIKGPRHHTLSAISAALNAGHAERSAPVQRIINRVHPPGGGYHFSGHGRAGPHNTADNRAALAELRQHRSAAPDPADRHVNNELEQNVVAAHANNPTGLGLHMAHHISNETVQQTIINAANAFVPGVAAAWGPVQAMIAGISPPLAAAALPAFNLAAVNAHNNALFFLNALTAPPAPPIPDAIASDQSLTGLAHAIANSPMNLHLGEGATNQSIGAHADANNYPTPLGLLGRRMTWRTDQMRAALAGHGGVPDRTLAGAAAMAPGTVAHNRAQPFIAAGLPPHAVHNSASRFFVPN